MLKSYKILVNGMDITSQIKDTITKITYRDNMGLKTDTCDFSFNNTAFDHSFLMPDASLVELELTDHSDKVLRTGSLYVDTRSGKIGKGHTVTIMSNSQPMNRPNMRQFVSYSKRKVALRTMLKDVLKKADLELIYLFAESPTKLWDINLKNVVIQNETIGAVIDRYASDFGCMLKLHDNQIIFANKLIFDQYEINKTIVPSAGWIEDFEYEINERQFSEFSVRYYNPRTGKTTEDKKNKKSILLTESQTVKRLIGQLADSTAARAVAMSVDGQSQVTISFKTDGDSGWLAGDVLQAQEFEEFTGKYVITSLLHEIGTGWNVRVEAENIF